MATEVIKTIKSSGGDYTSLPAFHTGESRDLVTADEIAVAEIYEDILANYVDFRSGWTTDATHRVVLRCPTISGEYDTNYYHAGVPGNGVTLDTDGGSYSILPVAHMTIAGLEITQSNTTLPFLYSSVGEYVRSEDLIVHDFYAYTAINNEYAKNCVFYNGTTSSAASTIFLKGGMAYNCSAYANGDGGYSGQIVFREVDCYGCAIYNTTTGGYDSFFSCTGDYNACNDTSAPGTNSLDSISDPFVDVSNGDLSIASDSVLKDAGPSSPYAYGDIAGTSRPQGDYSDIGAFEYVNSGVLPINCNLLAAASQATRII